MVHLGPPLKCTESTLQSVKEIFILMNSSEGFHQIESTIHLLILNKLTTQNCAKRKILP